ncbi:MAG: heavy-metal-associated domain-containing protein [Longimicrobiales bacterium]
MIALAVAVAACGGDDAERLTTMDGEQTRESAVPARDVPAGYATAKFAVNGMDCGGCALAARAALRKLPGVADAGADYDDANGVGSAWAVYDPAKVTPEKLAAAIQALGYEPTLVEG